MSNSSTQNQNKQKPTRLGRGLGSLLGGASDFDETPAHPAPSASVTPSPAQPAAPAKSSAQGVNAFVGGAGATAKMPAAPTTPAPAVGATVAGPATIAVPVYPQPQPIAEEAQIWMLPIDRLAPNTQQPRQIFTQEGLRDLSASI